MDEGDSTPRIAFLSPEPGSGKSRALEVTESLVPRPVHAVNVTANYLFRKVADEAGAPTVLFDEIDTVFGPRAKENEDIRGLLNAGHRKGATAGRCEIQGKKVVTVDFPAYCAVALAGLDDLPDTIMTRSVIIRMRRRAPDEKVEPWRRRLNAPEGNDLAGRMETWSGQRAHAWRFPEMPAGIEDRPADVWEALLAVADLAGGPWPDRARCSAVTLVTASAQRAHSLGVTLLRDVRTVLGNRERISTEELIGALLALSEAPWGDLRGKQLDARGLARRLGRYGVKPHLLRLGDQVLRGYLAADLHDPWKRYLQGEDAHPDSTDYKGLRDTPGGYMDGGGGISPRASRDFSVTSATPLQGGLGRHERPPLGAAGDQAALMCLSCGQAPTGKAGIGRTGLCAPCEQCRGDPASR